MGLQKQAYTNLLALTCDESETVLTMLPLTMHSYEKLSDEIVQEWFSEDIGYGSVLKYVIENSISGEEWRTATQNTLMRWESGISTQLDALGVGAEVELN